MAMFTVEDRKCFPLQSIDDVVDFFKYQLERVKEPNLTLISIVLGAIEDKLTKNRQLKSDDIEKSKISISDSDSSLRKQVPLKDLNAQQSKCCYEQTNRDAEMQKHFPVVELETIEALYNKFVTHVKGSVDLTKFNTSAKETDRELIKKVSDVIWNSLARSYHKDRAHLQSLFSYITATMLDCFGVAYAVVAACQLLSLSEVHLVLSEDHAWLKFGDTTDDTLEVTWHGKGTEDRRGTSIQMGLEEKSWLYLDNCAVECDRYMEVAACVSAINPTISASSISIEMATIQQKLLWLLHDKHHLEKYPMALGNLAELEEHCSLPSKLTATELLHKAIESSHKYYHDRHVYPYTYLGGYHYRHRNYKQAIKSWAMATSVIRRYNYNREDEEIYKEFLDIANERICNIVKVNGEIHHLGSLLFDSETYGLLLQFYDGICQWEEGSPTPVLHIGWAKRFVFSLSKFRASVREGMDIVSFEDKDKDSKDSENSQTKSCKTLSDDAAVAVNVAPKSKDNQGVGMQSTIEELESKVAEGQSKNDAPNPNIALLAQACGESILNPQYLLSGGEPFAVAGAAKVNVTNTSNKKSVEGMDEKNLLYHNNNNNAAEVANNLNKPAHTTTSTVTEQHHAANNIPDQLQSSSNRRYVMCSAKMKGLKDLLTSSKLNASAIQLQLTAQSQVLLKHKSTPDSAGPTRSKRLRRF